MDVEKSTIIENWLSADKENLVFTGDEIKKVRNVLNDGWSVVDIAYLHNGRKFRGIHDKEENVFKTNVSDEVISNDLPKIEQNEADLPKIEQNEADLPKIEQNEAVSENDNISGWLKDDFVFSDGTRGQLTNGALRARNYTIVVYPEDLPSELQKDDLWLNCFKDLKFHLVVSPLHDKDVNSDGTAKKAHRHLLIMGKKQWVNLNDLKEMVLTQFNGRGVAVPQKCSSTDGMIRYFSHIDNPEKYQYNKDEILCFNGANIDSAYKMSDTEKDSLIFEILEFLREHEEVTDYFQLVEYAMTMKRNEGDSSWFDTILKSSWVIERYISSRRNHQKDLEKAEKERNESEVMSLNNALVESNFKYKKQIQDLKNQVSLLKKELPEIVHDVQFEEDGIE
ncbi:TPA: Rep family protein [Streptococcus suis]